MELSIYLFHIHDQDTQQVNMELKKDDQINHMNKESGVREENV